MSEQIKNMVDKFGWKAVLAHAVLGPFVRKMRADQKQYVDENIDR